MKTLLETNINQNCRVVDINKHLPNEIIKRLKELGFTAGTQITLLVKNKMAKAGIVKIFGSLISLDYNVLSNIMVEV